MKLRLVRQDYEHDGIFGTLYDDNRGAIAVTLEHAYPSSAGDGSYVPKVPAGEYECVRGTHRLHDLVPFDTFEVEDVTGHDNILFHAGNINSDSNGCILIGTSVEQFPSGLGITESRRAFTRFMDSLKDVNQFTLIVE